MPARASTRTRRFLIRSACRPASNSASSGSDREAPATIDDQRGGALEPQHDVGREQPQLLALVVGGRERARTLLLGNRPRVLAANGEANELAEQRALVVEAGVDGFLGDARLVRDRGDARAFPAALLEQLSSGVEHPPACFLGLLGTTLGAVATGLDILGHGCHGSTVSNTVHLYRKEHLMPHGAEAHVPRDAALAYYEDGPELAGVVLDALRESGREVDPLDPDDLAGLDEFHGLGRAATLTMADLARISEGERVLDVGAGIGGPARTLAVRLGALVTALDPTRRFCDLNEELCRRSRLDDKIEVVCGDARRMPIGDGQFDVVWTQAVWPNIDDKHGDAQRDASGAQGRRPIGALRGRKRRSGRRSAVPGALGEWARRELPRRFATSCAGSPSRLALPSGNGSTVKS